MTEIADHAEVVRQQLLHLGPLRGAVGQESLDVLVAEIKSLRETLERVDSELDGINVDAAQRVARAALSGEQP